MSLLPMLFSNWWEKLEEPHRLMDQHFGLHLTSEDLPLAPRPFNDDFLLRLRRPALHNRYQPYERSLSRRSTGASVVRADKDKFHVTLDIQQFEPEEVTVKVVDKHVIVEGKHEERQDEHGWISRQFSRKYLVPEQCDIDELKSTLSSDGVLSITAPKKDLTVDKNERIIPIKSTGQPAIRDESANSAVKQKEPAPRNPVPQQEQDKTVKAA